MGRNTNWCQYDICETCEAGAGYPCHDLEFRKRTGGLYDDFDLLHPHNGRQRITTERLIVRMATKGLPDEL